MRALFRLLFVAILAGIVAYVWFGWRPAWIPMGSPANAPTETIDTQKARERGAEIGEKTAQAADRLKVTMAEAALTTKIKAKMALDDSIKARAIDVTTSGGTVTLSGRVETRAQHDRAIALARETDGVTTVVDRLTVERAR